MHKGEMMTPAEREEYTIQETFDLGMQRTLPKILAPAFSKLQLHIGAGDDARIVKRYAVGSVMALDLPEWNAGSDLLPVSDGTVDYIHAYHFFEHLDRDAIFFCLTECSRVLMSGGVLSIVVPYWDSALAHQDLNHVSFWDFDTMRTVVERPYNIDQLTQIKVSFEQHLCMLVGINSRNLGLFFQLVKV